MLLTENIYAFTTVYDGNLCFGKVRFYNRQKF